MKMLTKLAAVAAAAGVIVGMGALPAQAVGTSSQPCPGGSAVGHSSTNGGADTVASNCKGALHVYVRQWYTVTGGKVYHTDWKKSNNYVTTVKQANPGYPVYQAEHRWEPSVVGAGGPPPIFFE
ncbi:MULTISPECIES: hypothetical protein [Curtobacterium]|jgi:hypothetical protein|uniref:hypothetical protein n=1 Tax=Curtobacterium TaxID=2034 RepID=UPI0011A874C5|nr:hypothetical protein [Curtobacterium pusillum]